jgi:hypothetical protein
MKKVVFLLGTLSRFAHRGDALSGEDYALLNDVADMAHVDAEVVFCCTDLKAAGDGSKASMKMLRASRDRVLTEINGHKPDVVMAFGPVALKTVFNKGNVVLSEHLRQQFQVPGIDVPVYFSHSLDHVAAKPGMKKWLILDTRAAVEGFKDTQWGEYVILLPDDPNWHRCPVDFSDLPAGSVVGYDLETTQGSTRGPRTRASAWRSSRTPRTKGTSSS